MTSQNSWKTTRRHGLVAAITLALCSAFLFYSTQEAEQAALEHRQATQKLSQLKQNQQQAIAEANERETLQAQYDNILNNPRWMPFNPASFAENLHKIQQTLALQDFKYEFQPAVADSGSPPLLRHTMKIEFHARHEGELLRFLANLQQMPDTFLVTRHCSLQRSTDAGLATACQIDSYQLMEAAIR